MTHIGRVGIQRGIEVKPEELTLNDAERKKFRSLAATLNCMRLDGADVQYRSRRTHARRWRIRHKGVGKDVRGAGLETRRDEVDVHVDSGWAEGAEWKSTSGMTMINGAVVKHWWRTQATCALSTAEAECYAVVTQRKLEALGMQLMMMDLGPTAQVRVWMESNAANAIASRRGLGRMWNLYFCGLRVVVKSGRVKTRRAPGEQLLADNQK